MQKIWKMPMWEKKNKREDDKNQRVLILVLLFNNKWKIWTKLMPSEIFKLQSDRKEKMFYCQVNIISDKLTWKHDKQGIKSIKIR